MRRDYFYIRVLSMCPETAAVARANFIADNKRINQTCGYSNNKLAHTKHRKKNTDPPSPPSPLNIQRADSIVLSDDAMALLHPQCLCLSAAAVLVCNVLLSSRVMNSNGMPFVAPFSRVCVCRRQRTHMHIHTIQMANVCAETHIVKCAHGNDLNAQHISR